MQSLSATIRRSDSEYFARFAELGTQAPDPIWVCGPWRPSADRKSVAVVGSRAASARGLLFAERVGQLLAQQSIDVVSGGAIGIDAAAHEGALRGHGQTAAVLGTGLSRLYPLRHLPLFQQVIASGGALITAFAPEVGPRRQNFPSRNTLIAALADLVVVVEASLDSGSLYTATAARRLGRRLCALPGTPGTNDLIQKGDAIPVVSPEEVRTVLLGGTPEQHLPEGESSHLYAQLSAQPRDVVQLARSAGFPISTCAVLLGELESGGWAQRTLGGYSRLR